MEITPRPWKKWAARRTSHLPEGLEDLVAGIPLDKISMSFNESACSCPVTLAQYIIVTKKQGIDIAKLRGPIQNDPLHARYCGYRPTNPIDLSVRTSTDIIEYCTKQMPLWITGNVNMYDWREMGINAPQEISFGFAVALAYMDGALKRGLDIDDFAPRRGFYCSAHMDFFEEIAKLRAARRMWARIMKEKYGAKTSRSLLFRFGVHRVDPTSQRLQVERVRALKETRNNQKISVALEKLRRESEKGEQVNLMPAILEAVSAYATRGEIMGTIRQVYDYNYDPLGIIESPF